MIITWMKKPYAYGDVTRGFACLEAVLSNDWRSCDASIVPVVLFCTVHQLSDPLHAARERKHCCGCVDLSHG